MRTETIQIQLQGKATGAVLQTYFMDASKELLNSTRRPAVLLMPGGAYRYTSDREAEPLAIRLNAMGLQVAVLRYSCAPAAYPRALLEAAAAFQLLKDNCTAWNIRQDRIFLMGCSAGGHLAASLGINWNQPIFRERTCVRLPRFYAIPLSLPVPMHMRKAYKIYCRSMRRMSSCETMYHWSCRYIRMYPEPFCGIPIPIQRFPYKILCCLPLPW